MTKFDIWSEGYLASGMDGIPMRAQCIATNIEGENFIDAVQKWYNRNPS